MFQVPDPTPLPEIVVTGARLPPAASEAAFSVIRIDAEALRSEQRLDEALAGVPAVSLFRRTSSLSANPTTQGISLRAIAPSGAGRTLVTLDGVPLNDPFGGWVIWSQVPTESLSGLDILRGSGAGPYGAGALTGVIQLRERDSGLALDTSMGERGGVRASGSGVLNLGPARFVGSALYTSDDGYTPVRGSAAGVADTPLDLQVMSGALRADIPVSIATVSLRVSGFEEDRGSGLAGARATASGNALSAAVAIQPTNERLGWRLQLWRRESDLANTSVAVGADRGTPTPANDQFETPAVGWGLNAAIRRSTRLGAGRIEGELGADGRLNDGETRERFRFMSGAFTRDRVAGGVTSVAGLYAEGAWTDGPWLIAGGARWDQWRNAGGHRLERDLATGSPTLDETDPNRSGEVVSARLAARLAIGGDQSVRLAAYSGFRPATLNELHRPFRVGNDLTEPNAALTPETLTGAEAGWAWTSGRGSLTVTGFWTEIRDAVVNVTIGEGPATFPRAGFVPAGGVLRQRQNAGIIEATGLEIEGRLDVSDSVSLRAALSGTDARMDGGSVAPQLTGLRPAQAPIWSAVAGVDWRVVDRLSLAADLRWESRRFEDDLNSRTLAEALTVDLRADWTLSPSLGLWVAAINLFDEDVAVSATGAGITGYGPPRTLSVGIRLSR